MSTYLINPDKWADIIGGALKNLETIKDRLDMMDDERFNHDMSSYLILKEKYEKYLVDYGHFCHLRGKLDEYNYKKSSGFFGSFINRQNYLTDDEFDFVSNFQENHSWAPEKPVKPSTYQKTKFTLTNYLSVAMIADGSYEMQESIIAMTTRLAFWHIEEFDLKKIGIIYRYY
ncbi:MAG TPA: hypothetical protein VFM18_20285 [Methanosarcina sp.]|nr:hypothetical protein [Methanosarcina sp.]